MKTEGLGDLDPAVPVTTEQKFDRRGQSNLKQERSVEVWGNALVDRLGSNDSDRSTRANLRIERICDCGV